MKIMTIEAFLFFMMQMMQIHGNMIAIQALSPALSQNEYGRSKHLQNEITRPRQTIVLAVLLLRGLHPWNLRWIHPGNFSWFTPKITSLKRIFSSSKPLFFNLPAVHFPGCTLSTLVIKGSKPPFFPGDSLDQGWTTQGRWCPKVTTLVDQGYGAPGPKDRVEKSGKSTHDLWRCPWRFCSQSC